MGDLKRLDAAACCYSITIEVADPPDLTHLQLVWAVASRLAEAGCFAVLDAYRCSWHSGQSAASISPGRPLTILQEVSLIAETTPTTGFGHPVHTHGMIKFARPDLIAGVASDQIRHTGRILNHLARMLADGHVLVPGQKLRFDGQRTVMVTPCQPDATVPNVNLNNDGLLLIDV
jgi:hypothetical protein